MKYLTVSLTRGIYLPESGRRVPLTQRSAVSALKGLAEGRFYARPEVVGLLGIVARRATVECRMVFLNPGFCLAAWRIYKDRCGFGHLL